MSEKIEKNLEKLNEGKSVKVVVTKGSAMWCKVDKPAEPYSKGGAKKWEAGIAYQAEDPAWLTLKDELDAYHGVAMEQAKAKVRAAADKKFKKKEKADAEYEEKMAKLSVNKFYKEEVIDGEETGRVIITFKTNAEREIKKNGVLVSKKATNVPVVDAKRTEIPAPVSIPNGSSIRIQGSIRVYCNASVGISLYLEFIQVIEMADKASMMFEEEEGYEHDESMAAPKTDSFNDEETITDSSTVATDGEDEAF